MDTRWAEVKNILAGALEAQDREAFLSKACAADAELRKEVDSLLAFEFASTGGIFDSLSETATKLGHWRIEREIGRGGMGTVFLGHRDDGLYQQSVAVKILETQLRPAELVRRFEVERRILARLEHPHIARLLDAGFTPAGKPYLVLEWVDGLPLNQHAASLSLQARIPLFRQVCDAVAFAHRQLIVHLDLKPANILVKSDGVPKLLDFGLAKLLDPETGVSSGDPTSALLRVLTPAYASPEQIDGAPLSVSSDVYSLGVVFYELLAGRKPYEFSGHLSQQEIARALRAAPWQPTGAGTDLDLIARKALQQDPQQRYLSVEDFAADLDRFLRHEPITAREPSLPYRAKQFVRRNRIWLAAASVAVVGLGGGSALAWQQARLAKHRFDQVRSMANSFLFEFHDAIQTLPGSTEARALVLRRASEYLNGLEQESAGDTALRRELAQSYLKLGDAQGLYFEANLGQREAARKSYEKGLALLESIAAANPISPGNRLDLADAHIRVAASLSGARESEAALQHLRKAIEIGEAIPLQIPPVKIVLAKAHFGMAENFERLRRVPEALQERLTTIAILDGAVAAAPPGRAAAAKRWLAMAHKRYGATLLTAAGRVDEAIAEFQMAVHIDDAAAKAAPGDAVAQADLALDHHYLAAGFQRKGDRSEALRWLDQSVAEHRALAAQDPQNARIRLFLEEDEAARKRYVK